jgi:hypothetical protein
LISLYLTRSTIAPIFGAAGSLIVLLLWTYYSAQVFFLGAEFTQVYARTYGTRQRERPILEESVSSAETGQVSPEGHVVGSAPTAAPEQRRRGSRWRRVIIQPLRDIGLALGVIALVSVFNLLREPFRKE